jgi:uncharacterized protein (DUF58 family)
MMKPTRRAVAIFAAGIPPALLLVILAPGLWPLSFAFGGAVLIALAGDGVAAFRPRDLLVTVTAPERLYIGERGEIAVTLAARRLSRAIQVRILAEQTGALDPPEMAEILLEPRAEARLSLPVVPRRRGRARIERLWLGWRGPLGLLDITRIHPVGSAIDMLANVRGVPGGALRFFSKEAIIGIKAQRERGHGGEFDALRDYLPGMDSRFIDWKHSARHRRLLSKEFDTERNHQVIMGFDTGYLMREPMEGLAKLDHAINAGLLLAWISLRGGDLVGIYGFDVVVRHYLRPVRGLSAFARIQQSVAALEYRAEETNFTLAMAELNIRLRRRALVILFTDFVDATTAELLIESLQRTANRHVVLFVTLRDAVLRGIVDADPASFDDVSKAVIAHDMLRERQIVLERLERLGIHCLDVAPAGLSAGLINRYLQIKQRGLI